MRFLAIREERQPAAEVWSNYVHKLNVSCPACDLTYQLWAPLEEHDDDSRIAQAGEDLRQALQEDCPGHSDWFHLPAASNR